ncbi:conserved hypothetical protein [gamma proteobacterium NOR5-3]|nr:conserved hypothetical protein [gamma proteobacterium NOR5-3]
MDWFETLFGFPEGDWEWTQRQFYVDNQTLVSKANDRRFLIGKFSTPTLATLRSAARSSASKSVLEHIVVDDILDVQADPNNAGDMFQVASQFNTLEFPGPEVTPESGVTTYAFDKTQGPACALAAAPATVFRNYFAPVDKQSGQRADRQINNLATLEQKLTGGPYWTVKNGYIDSTAEQLIALDAALQHGALEDLMGHVRIGVQTGVDVTFSKRFTVQENPHQISQAFCSAVSCGYSSLPRHLWQGLATMVLDAAYEATLLAAAIDRDKGTGTGRVWLTMLGGGVFGNDDLWIAQAIENALKKTKNLGLDVKLAHFRQLSSPFNEIHL